MERAIEGGDDGLFDFRTAETVTGSGQPVQIEVARGLLPQLQVDGENGAALWFGRQVHEKDLVESAFAQELGRRVLEIVGGGDDKNRVLLFLEPGEECTEQSSTQPTILVAAALHGHRFLDFVDPEDGRRHRLGHRDGFAEVLFRLADVFVEQPAGVQLEQRKPPLPSDDLGRERLAAPLNPDDKDAARRVQVELAGLLGESHSGPLEPALEIVESAERIAIVLDRIVLQQSTVADDLCFAFDDARDVVRAESSVVQRSVRDDLARLIQRHATQRGHQLVELVGRQVQIDPLTGDEGLNHGEDRLAELGRAGKLEVEVHHLVGDVAGEGKLRPGQHHGRHVARKLLRYLTEFSGDPGGAEMGAKVLEVEDAGNRQVFDMLQHPQRFPGAVDRLGAGLANQPLRDRPVEHRQVQFGGHGFEQLRGTTFLHRLDRDDRMEREDECLEIVGARGGGHVTGGCGPRTRPAGRFRRLRDMTAV